MSKKNKPKYNLESKFAIPNIMFTPKYNLVAFCDFLQKVNLIFNSPRLKI